MFYINKNTFYIFQKKMEGNIPSKLFFYVISTMSSLICHIISWYLGHKWSLSLK